MLLTRSILLVIGLLWAFQSAVAFGPAGAAGSTPELAPGGSIILKKPIVRADRWHIPPGLWIISAVGKNGEVIVTDYSGRDYVVPGAAYIPTANEYSGLKPGNNILLSETIFRTDGNFLYPGIWSVKAIGTNGEVVIRDNNMRDYVVSPKQYVPAITDYFGTKAGDAIILKKSVPRPDGVTLSPGLHEAAGVGPGGEVVVRKVTDGVVRDFVVKRSVYTPQSNDGAWLKEGDLYEQRYLFHKRGLFPFSEARAPVLLIREDNEWVDVITARHFLSALDFQNQLDVFRVKKKHIVRVNSRQEYVDIVTEAGDAVPKALGSPAGRVLVPSALQSSTSPHTKEEMRGLHSHLIESLGSRPCSILPALN